MLSLLKIMSDCAESGRFDPIFPFRPGLRGGRTRGCVTVRFNGILAAVAVAGAVLAAASAQAATFVDGDFSSPSAGGSFVTYSAGQTFGPWLVTQGSVDLIGGYWQSPTPGGGSVDLDGAYQAGGISQTL